jgi:hypothetical protein
MPVVKTTKTFKELRDQAEKDFKKGRHHPAVALVYHGGGAVDFIGIRIECPKAHKEFVSRVPFGRDPEGELYYHDIKDLTGFGKYEILFQVGEVLQIVIRNPNNGIVATFVGQDPAKAIGWLQFDADHPDVPLIGDWKDYNGFDVPSTIKCDKGSTDVTISLPSLSKKVTFKLLSSCVNGISHDGTTTVSDINNISNGTLSMVDFDADRVLFYPKTGSTTMTAYFIPEIEEEADLVALGKQSFISTSAIAKWQ